MIFVDNRDNSKSLISNERETVIEELVSVFIGLALINIIHELIMEEHSADLEWDDYRRQTAFKLDWKWMIKC